MKNEELIIALMAYKTDGFHLQSPPCIKLILRIPLQKTISILCRNSYRLGKQLNAWIVLGNGLFSGAIIRNLFISIENGGLRMENDCLITIKEHQNHHNLSS